jgi:hypothetical protein
MSERSRRRPGTSLLPHSPRQLDVEFEGNEDVDGFEDYDTSDDDNKKAFKHRPGCISYSIVLIFLFSGLYGLHTMIISNPDGGLVVQFNVPPRSPAAPSPANGAQKYKADEINDIHSVPILSVEKPSPALTPALTPVVSARLRTRRPETQDLETIKVQLEEMIEGIRALKRSGVVMEEDEEAKRKIKEMQELCRKYLKQKYGPEPYQVVIELEFPKSMPGFENDGSFGILPIQLAPASLVPYSVYYVSVQRFPCIFVNICAVFRYCRSLGRRGIS